MTTGTGVYNDTSREGYDAHCAIIAGLEHSQAGFSPRLICLRTQALVAPRQAELADDDETLGLVSKQTQCLPLPPSDARSASLGAQQVTQSTHHHMDPLNKVRARDACGRLGHVPPRPTPPASAGAGDGPWR